MSLIDVERLREIAEIEFADLVIEALVPDLNELRVMLTDGSFVDVWFSLKRHGRYSFHWERQAIDGRIYRHDNAPHQRWQSVATFPCHSIMAAKLRSRRAISVKFPKKRYGNFWRSYEAGWAVHPRVFKNRSNTSRLTRVRVKWRKVCRRGRDGTEIHYFEHRRTGRVWGIKIK